MSNVRHITPADLERFKREAKRLRRRDGITHLQALDALAEAAGYPGWWQLQHRVNTQPAAIAKNVSAADVLLSACTQLLGMSDFWLLCALGDWSFEEGARNRRFGRYVDSWWDHRFTLPEELRAIARRGINGNLREIIAARPEVAGPVDRNPSFGPDLVFGIEGDPTRYTVEVKQVFDGTLPKYFAAIAADREKGCHFQVIFFVTLPEYDYPAGSWYGSNRIEPSRRRHLVGLPRQLGRVAEEMTNEMLLPSHFVEADLPAGTHIITDERVNTRFSWVLTSPFPWRFEAAKHLKDAKVAVAIWRGRADGSSADHG